MGKVVSWFHALDPTQIFACTFFGLITLAWLTPVLLRILQVVESDPVQVRILKYLRCRNVVQRHSFWPSTTWADLICVVVLVAANAVAVLVPGLHKSEIVDRAGILCLINVVPLFFSNQLSYVAGLVGISLSQAKFLHSLIGAIALVNAAIHIALHPSTQNMSTSAMRWTIAAASSLPILFVLPMIGGLRRRCFEMLTATHTALAGILIAGLWFHIVPAHSFSRYYVFASLGLLALNTTLRLLRCFINNIEAFESVNHRYRIPRLLVLERVSQRHGWEHHRDSGLLRVKVGLVKRPRFHRGQYIYLWAPGTSLWAFFQSHPFVICDLTKVQKQSTFAWQAEFVICPKRGWTSELADLQEPDEDLALKPICILDGPYGRIPDVHRPTTIVLVAGGAGILAHLPLLQEIVAKKGQSLAFKVVVLWQLLNAALQGFLHRKVEEMLSSHKGIFFQVHGTPDQTEHERVEKHVEPLDCEQSIKTLLDEHNKRDSSGFLVAVSAPHFLRKGVRDFIARSSTGDLLKAGFKYTELDYQPQDIRPVSTQRVGWVKQAPAEGL